MKGRFLMQMDRAPEAEEALKAAFELCTEDEEVERLLEECMVRNRTQI